TDLRPLVRYVFSLTIDAYYHFSALPRLAPFLLKYWLHSRPARHAEQAREYSKLIEHGVRGDHALAQQAGATGSIRRNGWLKVFRTEHERDKRFAEAERWRAEFGVHSRLLGAPALPEIEPHV